MIYGTSNCKWTFAICIVWTWYYMFVDRCLYGLALSGTLLVYGSHYVDEEDRDGLGPFVYKSVLREGEALSFT